MPSLAVPHRATASRSAPAPVTTGPLAAAWPGGQGSTLTCRVPQGLATGRPTKTNHRRAGCEQSRKMTMNNIKTVAAFHDTFIREVRATYLPSETPLFPIKGPEDVAAFIRSILTDNSREHFVALYLDGAHCVASYSLI